MAMFRKPSTSAIVAIGTTIGFLMAGFPIIIVARALTHLVFAALGAYYLQKAPNTLVKTSSRTAFNFVINTIHGLGEVAIVYALTTAGVVPPSDGFMYTLIVLIGIGTLIHGMVDFEIAYQITKAIEKRAHLGFAQIAL
jgi:niacin transporter